jgi:tRNA1Val (adenine37-N6)-methyltransferase
VANSYFEFKQFTVFQDQCAMKVGTDGVLLGAWVTVQQENKLLDIGTGTGLIALMLAQRTEAEIVAVEIEPCSCAQAKENFIKSPWKNRISALNTSIQDYSEKSETSFDLVVSNPPFFSNSLKTPHPGRTMARHNDLLQPEEILTSISRLLTPDGRFALILPYVESSLFIVDAAMYGFYCIRKTMVRSSAKKKPHRLMMEFSRSRRKPEETELLIYDDFGHYTPAYRELTKEFYLSF